jgi:hypothetical protein
MEKKEVSYMYVGRVSQWIASCFPGHVTGLQRRVTPLRRLSMRLTVKHTETTSSLVGLVIALDPQTPKHIRGGWSHYTNTSEPVDSNGAQNKVTVQSGFRTGDLSITGPTCLPTAISGHTTSSFLIYTHAGRGQLVEIFSYSPVTYNRDFFLRI